MRAVLTALAVLLPSAVLVSQPPPDDPADMAEWPNVASRANSDPWIAENHGRIRVMRPRLLVLNFCNNIEMGEALRQVKAIIVAVREGSRYHGYRNVEAPAFLEYAIYRIVDARDPDRKTGNGRRAPVKPAVTDTRAINCDYGGFFSAALAEVIGVRDPAPPHRFLRLDELVDRGHVHEVWFIADCDGVWRCLESVEQKPLYDDERRIVKGEYRQSGNGGDPDQKWTGRSVRLACINPTRGPGCFLESLSHSIEGIAHGGAIPYFRKYFYEYGGFDLDRRFGIPAKSLYAIDGRPPERIEYPDATTLAWTHRGTRGVTRGYQAAGGNVHFTPTGRWDYDLDSPAVVRSTIEHFRLRDGADGKDIAEDWSNARWKDLPVARMAGDCMGPWLVYWRQNFPGLDNRAVDDEGRPMLNWWPFLFY